MPVHRATRPVSRRVENTDSRRPKPARGDAYRLRCVLLFGGCVIFFSLSIGLLTFAGGFSETASRYLRKGRWCVSTHIYVRLWTALFGLLSLFSRYFMRSAQHAWVIVRSCYSATRFMLQSLALPTLHSAVNEKLWIMTRCSVSMLNISFWAQRPLSHTHTHTRHNITNRHYPLCYAEEQSVEVKGSGAPSRKKTKDCVLSRRIQPLASGWDLTN